jgi:hypothetical protein
MTMLQEPSMTIRKQPSKAKRRPSSTRYSSKIIKAGALIGDTKTLLSHWDAGASVADNIDRIRRDNVFGKASRQRRRWSGFSTSTQPVPTDCSTIR